MDELERPSPKAMALRRPNLQPRTKQQPSRLQMLASQPKRHAPVDMAWCDTGTLLSLGRQPAKLEKVQALYGSSLVVTYAVAHEVRAMANIAKARRTPENRARCESADVIARMLDAGDIPEHPLLATPETLAMIDRVLRQLDAIDERKRAAFNRIDDAERTTQKHAGEAHSIVSAMRTLSHGAKTVLLTNDDGAMRVAERNGVSWRHTGQLLAELGCQDAALSADVLLADFNQMTSSFATVPADVRPNSPDFFTCRMKNGACTLCDSVN